MIEETNVLQRILRGELKSGYIPEKRVVGDAVYDFIFKIAGAQQESFDWRKFKVPSSRQGWIPFCVSFARRNIAAAEAKRNGLDLELSPRELGVISGTTMAGNTLQAVSDSFKNLGIRTEQVCPFTPRMITYSGDDIWKEIFDLSQIANSQKYQGGNHSWVVGSRAAMIDAMNYSPLQVSMGIGETWENSGIVTPPKNIGSYHSVALLYIDAQGNLYIQDSLSDGKEDKILSPDYPLTGIKSFRDLPDNWKGLTMGTVIFIHKVQSSEYGFLEITNWTEIYYRGISSEDIKFMAKKFGLNILNPDGSVNFSLAKEVQI